MVIKAILEGILDGTGKFHKTPIFPCSIFQCMKGVNREPGDPNYDLFRLSLKCTAKRIYPNYGNCDVQMQQDWIKFDRDNKQKIINELSEEDYNKLLNKLETYPELKEILMVDVVEVE